MSENIQQKQTKTYRESLSMGGRRNVPCQSEKKRHSLFYETLCLSLEAHCNIMIKVRKGALMSSLFTVLLKHHLLSATV